MILFRFVAQEVYQKQFSIGEILSESWKRFRENFQLIVIITLIFYVPINIILSFIILSFVPFEESILGFKQYSLVVQILGSLIGFVATMAIAYAIKSKIDGKSISVGEALKKSFSRLGAAIGTSVIEVVFLIGLAFLLVVPAIIYSVYWIFSIFEVVLNNRWGKDALDHSKQIVKGRWWLVMGYSIVFGLLGLVVATVGSILLLALPENFLTDIVTNTLFDILLSFFVVVMTILFINFDSTKKEGDVKVSQKKSLKSEVKNSEDKSNSKEK